MQITFIIPPVLDNTANVDRCFGCNYNIYFLPLLPVLYSATIIKETGESVSIIDFAALGKSEQDFKDFISKDGSELYVFYTVFLSQKTDLAARDFIRRERPNARFIFFGPQATYAAGGFLDREDTVLVRGEPEFTMRELVSAFARGADFSALRGISFKSAEGLRENPPAALIADLDTLPIPDRTLLDHTPYSNPKLSRLPHTAALTSRGCFGQCWYCVPNSLSYARELEYKKYQGHKPPARLHSASRVIEEFHAIAGLGFKSVSIIDDQFLWDEARTLEICRGIKGLGLEWSCLCRPERITKNAAEAMAEAGCGYVDIGTESFDEAVLASIQKDMSPADTRKAVATLRQAGIEVEINILLGATPVETEESIKKTLREVRRLNADYVLFSIANPFPGTEFYQAAKSRGWMYYGDYVPADPAKNSIISYPHLSKKKLERLLAHAYLSFYLDPRYLVKQALKIRSVSEFKSKLRAFANFIYKNFIKR